MAPSLQRLSLILLGFVLLSLAAGPAASQAPARGHGAEGHDMELVGHDDLQGRSAYQPTIHQQRGRWIAYVGHHGGRARNPLTGVDEDSGVSIVDVTDPARPRYLTHIPGMPGGPEAGGAQMVRACEGSKLPKGGAGRTYLLRTFGNSLPNSGHEVWDVTDPEKPQKLSTVLSGLTSTHKNWWECETGIAYLISGDLAGQKPLALGPSGWRTWRMTKIYDLSDPAKPVFIRDFGLAGQEPGSTGPIPIAHGVHGPIALGHRVYFAYGTSAEGALQIVDRQKLLTGPKEPTAANLNFPEISRLYMSPNWGGHTAFPVLGVTIPDWAPNTEGRVRDFVVVVSEATGNECREYRHATFVIDISTEAKPFSVATFEAPESKGNFCRRGGRFGPHSSSESFAPIFYRKLVFIAYFNGGVRAMDIRNPYAPREAAFYIPATTERTAERCVTTDGARACKVAIQTNNVEADERGYVYLADRANTGLHIVRLTGEARRIVGGN
ncbi:MAG: hypothetical protein AUH29_13930 [Candidatus Rokubacteria bacterium 13_1_40CM_69_27]|nr:MAG: hypothetical protein AUH29_13930 [Candidatus Rokubacteria bacterium 13_1_40CM_69_27]